MRSIIQDKEFDGLKNVRLSTDTEPILVLECSFIGCGMEGSYFIDAVFVRCRFCATSLYWSQLFRALFVDCAFTEVNFCGAGMDECQFVRCMLTRCDFRNDNLGGSTDLSKVEFVNSERKECLY
jgi:uncharacterized protein YjbI with pentapeptide repeats